MTISNASRTAGPFIGDGVSVAFPFSYKVFSRADVLVAKTVTATGVESILVLDADYAVTLNTNQNSSPGGVITLMSPLATGTSLAATSNIPIQQSLDLTNNGGFYPTVINDALDRIVITIQQLAARIGTGALNVGAAANIAAILSTLTTLAGNTGASLIGFLQAGTGAVLRTVRDKLRERISVEDFGAVGDGVADDTLAIQRAISASVGAGGHGTVYLRSGRRYNFTSLSIDGILGLTIKGQNGGNVGNLAPGSSGGASMLVCTSLAGDSLSFTGVAYHAAQITLEDLVLYTNTPGYALTFNNVSQINLKRCTVTNAGGAAYNQGNGLRFSNCYYVNAEQVYVWKSGTLYSVGCGVTIDRGAVTAILAGLYNFNNCSIYGFQTAAIIGEQDQTTTANIGFANFNFTNSELNSNGQGIMLYYGVKTAVISGCYLEGNLQLSVGVYNRATNVLIEKNFINGFSSSTADIQLGQSGSGAYYPKFYNAVVRNNQFAAVNIYGIRTYAGTGSSIDVSGNTFTLGTAGAIAVGLGESAAGDLTAIAERNNFYGFAAGNALSGAATRYSDNFEYDTAGVLVRAVKNAVVTYAAFADFTQIQPNDPDTTLITNTTASARYINGAVAKNKGRRQHITLSAASTQNVRLMASDTTTQLALLTPGKGAIMWNDGTNEYASLLP